jgi:hypothetical protein
MSLLVLPFMLLNFFAGIVGGIWLALLGEWEVVVLGLGLSFVGAAIVGILLMPSLLIMLPIFGAAAAARLDRSPIFMGFAALLGVGYTYCIMGLWAHAIFRVFTWNMDADAKLPILLWCYAASTAVWNYMAQRDNNEWTPMSAFFHQVGCVSLMVYAWGAFPRLQMWPMIWWYMVPMVCALLFQVAIMFLSVREARRSGLLD